MAASASASDPPRGAKHRRPLLNDLQIQVPAANSAAGWSGRPSGPASAPPCGAHAAGHNAEGGHGRQHADRSPSLLRSPSAWIRAKGQSFGSSKHAHRRSGNFHYDAISYAHNFDEGGGEEDAPRHACFSPRIPTASQPASPSSSGLGARGGNDDNGHEPAAARETAGSSLD